MFPKIIFFALVSITYVVSYPMQPKSEVQTTTEEPWWLDISKYPDYLQEDFKRLAALSKEMHEIKIYYEQKRKEAEEEYDEAYWDADGTDEDAQRIQNALDAIDKSVKDSIDKSAPLREKYTILNDLIHEKSKQGRPKTVSSTEAPVDKEVVETFDESKIPNKNDPKLAEELSELYKLYSKLFDENKVVNEEYQKKHEQYKSAAVTAESIKFYKDWSNLTKKHNKVMEGLKNKISAYLKKMSS